MVTVSKFTAEELRIAARVARDSGGLYLPAAAAAWEFRARVLEGSVSTDAIFGE